jgi:hypothetical protein
MYGKYGYDPSQAAIYVLHHISLGRPLNYHSIPNHLYWKKAPGEETHRSDNLDLFTRAESGWAEGLHRIDRFIKNTYEILSPLNELTAQLQMTGHEFLTSDRKVQRTLFGSGPNLVSVTVNMGSADYKSISKSGGSLTLPPLGFVIDSPRFVAFYSRNWNGRTYDKLPLFTLRSLDDKLLTQSRKIRIFHAFGDEQIRLNTTLISVPREIIVDPKAQSKS